MTDRAASKDDPTPTAAAGRRRFWVLVVVTGAAAGLTAAGLLSLLGALERLAWPGGADGPGGFVLASVPRRLLLLAAAGALVSVVTRVGRARVGGHGTAELIEAVWLRAGSLPALATIGRGLLAIVVVALGAPLGREGALLQIGAAIGSRLGRAGVNVAQRRLLVACGASAGFAAVYNIPIGASMFGMEVLLGSFALELFAPVVVASVTATLVARSLLGDQPGYLIPSYSLGAPSDLVLGGVVGVLLGGAAALYVRTMEAATDLAGRAPRQVVALLPLIALLAVGGIASFFPQILGNGYGQVKAALVGDVPLGLLVALPFLKMLASAGSSAAGVPGGVFTPSLFYGAMLGGALGSMAHLVAADAPPSGAFALLGMGAILAGTTHASVSAVLILFELTRDYAVILPLMLTCVVAAAVSKRLEPESLYTAALGRRRVSVPHLRQVAWPPGLRVAGRMHTEIAVAPSTTPLRRAVVTLFALPAGQDLYLVDPGHRYLGLLTIERVRADLSRLADTDGQIELAQAAEAMETVEPLPADLLARDAITRFASERRAWLPVVHPGTGELLGAVSREDVERDVPGL